MPDSKQQRAEVLRKKQRAAQLRAKAAQQPPEEIGAIEAIAQGVGAGLTFNTSDEIYGGVAGFIDAVKAKKGNFLDNLAVEFQKRTQEARERIKRVEEERPIAFETSRMISGIGKDIALTAATGGAASLPRLLGTGAALGAAEFAGAAEEDRLTEAAKGAAIGLTGAGIAKGVGAGLSKLGTLGRRAMGKPSLTQQILGKQADETSELYLKLATQGRRPVSLGRKAAIDASDAFAKANKLKAERTGKAYVEKTAKGFGLEVVKEAEEFGAIRKGLRNIRAKALGDTPNDLRILVDEMNGEIRNLSVLKRDIFKRASAHPKIGDKLFNMKKVGIENQLNEMAESSIVLNLPKGSKINRILKTVQDKKMLSFKQVDDVKEFIDDSLKRSWKDPIDSSSEKVLKKLRRSITDFQKNQIGKALGGKTRLQYEKALNEIHNTIDALPELAKADDALFRGASAEIGRGGAPAIERAFEIAAPQTTQRGQLSIRGTLGNLGKIAAAGVQVPSLVAGETIEAAAPAIGGRLASIFPSLNQDTGELKDPIDIQKARHFIDKDKNVSRRAKNIYKLNATKRLSLDMLPADVIKGLGIPISSDIIDEAQRRRRK